MTKTLALKQIIVYTGLFIITKRYSYLMSYIQSNDILWKVFNIELTLTQK